MKIIKGILKTVSKHGGIIFEEDQNKWYNAENEYKKDLNVENIKHMIGKEISLELNDKGYYINIEKTAKTDGFTNADILKEYTKIEIIQGTFDYVEIEVNKFSKQNRVIATQTHIISDRMVAVVFYKVVE